MRLACWSRGGRRQARCRLPTAKAALVASADGDRRFLLNQVETLFTAAIDQPLIRPRSRCSCTGNAGCDKDRDGHYNLISALHKALRGSDPRRRSIISRGCRRQTASRSMCCGGWCASPARMSAWPTRRRWCNARHRSAYQFLGPEELAIVQACLYLATAPNRMPPILREGGVASARHRVARAPANILNAPTKLMKDRLRRRLRLITTRRMDFRRRLLARGWADRQADRSRFEKRILGALPGGTSNEGGAGLSGPR